VVAITHYGGRIIKALFTVADLPPVLTKLGSGSHHTPSMTGVVPLNAVLPMASGA
jgi:hypothetical protein